MNLVYNMRRLVPLNKRDTPRLKNGRLIAPAARCNGSIPKEAFISFFYCRNVKISLRKVKFFLEHFILIEKRIFIWIYRGALNWIFLKNPTISLYFVFRKVVCNNKKFSSPNLLSPECYTLMSGRAFNIGRLAYGVWGTPRDTIFSKLRILDIRLWRPPEKLLPWKYFCETSNSHSVFLESFIALFPNWDNKSKVRILLTQVIMSIA